MRYLYDIVFLLFSIIYLPYLLIKGKARGDFIQRFGVLPKHLRGGKKDTIWVHAVSVGEVNTAKLLINDIKEKFPYLKIVLSTTTTTGASLAADIFGNSVPKFYFPLDIHFITDYVVNFLNPACFIVIDTEMWPNLIMSLSAKKVPAILVNGRISDKSYRRYKFIKPVFSNVLRKITKFLMQTGIDAERIVSLGAPPERVKVTGSIKYDASSGPCAVGHGPEVSRDKLGIADTDDFIICGSTHKGEEEVLLEAYKELLQDFPNLRILIAPRHIDRVGDIEKLCKMFGFDSITVSAISHQPSAISRKLTTESRKPVLILDTIGQLAQLYSLAIIVFMGGSLIKRGGHNLVEPARLGKPVVHGPYMNNFRDMASQFLREGASVVVRTKEELEEALRGLFADRAKIDEMGKKAIRLVEKNKGATSRTIEEIREILNRKT